MPRKRVRTFSDPERGDGAIANTITRPEIDPTFGASMFKMKLPAGYERTDDFAP